MKKFKPTLKEVAKKYLNFLRPARKLKTRTTDSKDLKFKEKKTLIKPGVYEDEE